MPTIEPVASALDALVAYLDDVGISGLTVLRGWPEANVDLTLDESHHAAAVTAGPPRIELVSPKAVSWTAGVAQWHVADVEVLAQLDLWCAYRVGRDTVAQALEAALHNRLPFQPGLWLTSAGYFNRPLVVDLGASRAQDGDSTAPLGTWRKTWDLTIRGDMVVEATHPTLATVILRETIRSAGISIVELDKQIT